MNVPYPVNHRITYHLHEHAFPSFMDLLKARGRRLSFVATVVLTTLSHSHMLGFMRGGLIDYLWTGVKATYIAMFATSYATVGSSFNTGLHQFQHHKNMIIGQHRTKSVDV